MQNRTRNKQLNLKFTEEEINYFKEKKKLSRVNNYTDFLLKAAANRRIYNIDTKPLLALVNEINKIGVNINQIAKIANTTGEIYSNKVSELQQRITLLENKLSDLLRKIEEVKRS